MENEFVEKGGKSEENRGRGAEGEKEGKGGKEE